jgi:response regulator RpfG family c-di-GMP phosphodiesterase
VSRFLVITGGVDKNIHAHVLQMGVEHFLSKPFTEAELKKKVTDISSLKML